MASRRSRTGLTTMAVVRQRINAWRRNRKKHGPMPEELWQDAVELANRLGASRVSKALRVFYRTLKDRMNRQYVPALPEATSAPTFVEVAFCPPDPSRECVVEMKRPDGGKMIIRRPDRHDLVALSATFWGWRV